MRETNKYEVVCQESNEFHDVGHIFKANVLYFMSATPSWMQISCVDSEVTRIKFDYPVRVKIDTVFELNNYDCKTRAWFFKYVPEAANGT